MKKSKAHLLVVAGLALIALLASTAMNGRAPKRNNSTLAINQTADAVTDGSFFFSTGDPDGRIASVSHPEGRGKTEHESADDFVLTSRTELRHAAFTGVLFHGGHGEIREVVVELYHVFPKDSNVARTSGPPDFSTAQVPTRVNSPADKRFDARSSEDGTLQFIVTVLDPNFEAANSVIEGINPKPDQATGGEGPVAGQEVRIDGFHAAV